MFSTDQGLPREGHFFPWIWVTLEVESHHDIGSFISISETETRQDEEEKKSEELSHGCSMGGFAAK